MEAIKWIEVLAFPRWDETHPPEAIGRVPESAERIGLGGLWTGERLMRPAEPMLIGVFASYWPQHAAEWPGINEATKYVVSNTLREHEWSNSVFINGDAMEEIRKLKQGDGPPLHVYGSSNLLQTLLKHDLIDELWLNLPDNPRRGKRLFQDGTSAPAFTLESTTTSPSGVIVANYRPAGEVKTGSL
jgi:dihydrofolate reductase